MKTVKVVLKILEGLLFLVIVTSCTENSDMLTSNDEHVRESSTENTEILPGLIGDSEESATRTSGSQLAFYRYYSPYALEHYYSSHYDDEWLPTIGYQYQKAIGFVHSNGNNGRVPLYRYYNHNVTNHFYTANWDEGVIATQTGYLYEGIAGYIYTSPASGRVPLRRYYKPSTCDHFYSTDISEHQPALDNGYEAHGIDGYLEKYVSTPVYVPASRGNTPTPRGRDITIDAWTYNDPIINDVVLYEWDMSDPVNPVVTYSGTVTLKFGKCTYTLKGAAGKKRKIGLISDNIKWHIGSVFTY